MDPRHKIRSIVPRPPSQGGDLSKVATDALIECAHDSKERGWVRSAVVRELGRRLGESALPLFEELLKSRDLGIRIAALTSMCAVLSEGEDSEARRSLVAWLQSQSGIDVFFSERVLSARAALGDVSVTLELVILASHRLARRRAVALDALEALRARASDDAILKELGYASYLEMATDAPRFEVRLHGVRELHDADEDITAFLADPSRIVARYVFDALADSNVDVTVARQLAETAQSQEARAWAALALRRAGISAAEAMAFLEEPLVPAAGVPDDIRDAIVRECAFGPCDTNPRQLLHREMDPRWLLERTTLPEVPRAELDARTDARVARLMAALEELGLNPVAPFSAADAWERTPGTYLGIAIPGLSYLWLSTLGPFVVDQEHTPPEIRAAVETCGLTWVEEYGQTVNGLFGTSGGIDVGELLFHYRT
ncbi:MAG: HEAT repeat domain-containing protein [Polyangiales bacterium]